MSLDPQARAALDRMAEGDPPAVDTLSVSEARTAHVQSIWMSAPGDEIAAAEDRFVTGPKGNIRVRVYTPNGDGPWPVLVYFHGGGWVVGSLETVDPLCRTLAARTPCVVVSVDYGLAPEHKFPEPLEECFAATTWAAAHAAELGSSPGRLAVGGDSAGGNLAAAVALKARDRGGPAIGHQLLVYPVADHNFTTSSYEDNATGYGLTRDAMMWYWNHYLAHEKDALEPYASVLRADDLAGLPPATVITAEYDVLRDEGLAFARVLAQAEVPVRTLHYEGMIHGFFRMTAVIDKADEAIDEAAAALRAALGAP